MDLRGGAFLAILFIFAGLTGLPASPAAEAEATTNVEVGNFYFSPDPVTLSPGDSITWSWMSGTHNVQSRDGSDTWCSTRSSGSCSKTFPDPGTYEYRCGIHPGSMQATINVQGTSDPPVVTIDTPLPGGEVEGTFTATGSAAHDLGISEISWRIADSGWQPVDTLDDTPEGADWSAVIDVTTVPEGSHDLEVQAVSSDNQAATESISVFVKNKGFIDLVAVGLHANNQQTFARLSATIRNDGLLDADSVPVVYQYQYHDTWRTIDTLHVNMAPGVNLVRTVQWESEGKIGMFPVRVVLDPDETIEDVARGNNDRQTSAYFFQSFIPGTDPFEPV